MDAREKGIYYATDLNFSKQYMPFCAEHRTIPRVFAILPISHLFSLEKFSFAFCFYFEIPDFCKSTLSTQFHQALTFPTTA